MSQDYAMSLDSQELAPLARGRSSLYSLLELFFTRLPDASFIRQLRETHVVDRLQDLASDVEQHPDLVKGSATMRCFLKETAHLPEDGLAETLGVDRTRLYRGVSGTYGPQPPYEALWTSNKRDPGILLSQITAIYRESGLVVGGDTNERADYAGTELDYMACLAAREAEAWERKDADEAIETVRKEAAFVKSFNEWVPKFVAQAESFAQTDLYRGHMLMLRGFLADEQERLNAMMDEIQRVSG